MDKREARIKELVSQLAEAVGLVPETTQNATPTSDKILARIVLGDILDDSILSAKVGERTFPLRLFFGELGSFLTKEGDAADHAFTLASGLNFFFRADMDAENKARVAIEVSSSGDLKNGRKYRQEYHFLIEFRDGKICAVREYLDTHHAHDVWIAKVSSQD